MQLIDKIKQLLPTSLKNSALMALGWSPEFDGEAYRRVNERRLEHLATLGLAVSGKTVLELGAGTGSLTSFFLDRGCSVVAIEGREQNIRLFRRRHPDVEILQADIDEVAADPADRTFDIAFCYGLLYHLSRPAAAIDFMSRRCSDLLLLETCVSVGATIAENAVEENANNVTQAIGGRGCRPTRGWVMAELRRHFPWVYATRTQPSHPWFPGNWSSPPSAPMTRAVFVASRTQLANTNLVVELPMTQPPV